MENLANRMEEQRVFADSSPINENEEPSLETQVNSLQLNHQQQPNDNREENEKLSDEKEEKSSKIKKSFKQEEYTMNGERGCFLVVDLIVDDRSDLEFSYLRKVAIRMGFKERYVQRVKFDIPRKNEGEKVKEEILDIFASVGKAQHEQYDCFFCVLLAYASHDIKCYYNANFSIKLTLKELVDPFTGEQANTLSGKPKIFLVHAPKKLVAHEENATQNKADADIDVNELPNHSDFYIAVIRPEDQAAYVNYDDGRKGCSWFVKNFARIINSHLSLDFSEQMTMLYREMIRQFPQSEVKNDGRDQPFYWNRMQFRKKLNFN